MQIGIESFESLIRDLADLKGSTHCRVAIDVEEIAVSLAFSRQQRLEPALGEESERSNHDCALRITSEYAWIGHAGDGIAHAMWEVVCYVIDKDTLRTGSCLQGAVQGLVDTGEDLSS